MAVEQKIYADYKEWVSDRKKDIGFEIQTAKTDIEELTAFIEKADSKVAQLGRDIAGLDADISRLEGEKKDATTVRNTEHAEYVKLQKDYSESVDALERAIQVLSTQAYDRPQAEMLLQRMTKTTPGMRRVLAAFLQEKEQAEGAPAVAAYDFQSHGIIEVLEGLLKKFKGELDGVESDEANAAHYYDLEMIHLGNTIAKTKSDREEKAGIKAETAAASAKAKGDLGAVRKDLASDEAFLADMIATFQSKTATYMENQQVRKDELEALSKAIEIISSTAVADGYAEHINLAQVPPARQGAFVQLRSSKRRVDARQRAVELLRKRGTALSSRVLTTFAAQIAENPFAKVIQMIEDLLARLKEEASAEADHKAWCDEQLMNNKLKREKRTANVNSLSAQIDGVSSDIADMGKKIDTLVAEQASLAKAMQEATAQRLQEKATNEDTIRDAQAGAAAVQKAMAILQEFYASQETAAFLQQRKQVPEMPEYRGMHGKKKGVLGLLEVILTDFMRLEADTKASEEQLAKEYERFMSDAKASKLQKHNMEVKTRLEKDQAEFDKSQLQKDLAANQEQLDMANKYYDYLKPNCVEIHVNYEARAARRKEEIAALKEAWSILDTKTSTP
uniref:Uncharacterized protein n=1 Tax=Pyrodinium bahamense TaxID=73915 RepID=A0A7S0BAR7_9DINO